MQVNDLEKRVIDLNAHDVRDETLDAIETEIHAQADDDLDSIDVVTVFVLDGRRDKSLDSHATVFADHTDADPDQENFPQQETGE